LLALPAVSAIINKEGGKMKGSHKLAWASTALGLALVAALPSGIAQHPGPTEDKGLTAMQLVVIDLGPEIPGMTGRQLRMRKITIDPGGVTAAHVHKERPAIDYVLQGTIVDHRGNEAKEYGPGTTIVETEGTMHWLENKGTNPAVEISADILKQP
jgi:quercetin dioxygenase-like cupin family protein